MLGRFPHQGQILGFNVKKTGTPPKVHEKSAWPEEQVPAPKPKPVDEVARKYGRARPKKPLVKQLTDEDFDPRA